MSGFDRMLANGISRVNACKQCHKRAQYNCGAAATGRAATGVLSRPGAVGKLLAIAAKSPDVDVFADSMVAALSSTTLPETASLDEMKLLLEQVLRCFG